MKNRYNFGFKVVLLVALCLIIVLSSAACGAKDSTSSDQNVSDNTDTQWSTSSGPNLMWGDTPLGQTSSDKTSSLIPQYATDNITYSEDKSKSNGPAVTVSAQVDKDVCIVAGFCTKETEKITVSGENVTSVTITPYAGNEYNYYSAQVKYSKSTYLRVTATEKGKKASEPVSVYMAHGFVAENYMQRNEYAPVFGKNSRMHFYSALLAYSQNTKKLDSKMRAKGRNNVKNLVSAADAVGAETIFLIIPSSADIYPETVPDNYTKASGERLYSAFAKIAESFGAKVIYPIDTMKKHKNDGVGYQLYQSTDSHWSTYGAYWGTYDMLNYIAKKYPAARPRTLSEMNFYTKELCAGDAFFNFPNNIGFENNYGSGITYTTKMKELTTLYKLKMPTNTLEKVYNSYNGLYLTNDNADAATVTNKSGKGLPTAVIMRDSFGKVSYDMLNDRFSTVYWGEFDNYNLPIDTISKKKPDYVIHLYSERNLLKILLGNSEADLLNLN